MSDGTMDDRWPGLPRGVVVPKEPEPDFVDVHVTLDWVIRVHGQTDAEQASQIAIDYLNDQDLHSLVEVLPHEDGVVCDGEESKLDEDGNLDETELTIALYPEDGPALPTNIPVAVATYAPPYQPELRS